MNNKSTDDEREALNTLYWTHPDGHTTGLSSDAIDAILASEVWRFRRFEVPEPSAEEQDLIDTANQMRKQTSSGIKPGSLIGLWLRTASALEARINRPSEPQGEPSDAQVEAAAREYHERGNGEGSFDRMADHVRTSLLFRMRAALRAVGGAR